MSNAVITQKQGPLVPTELSELSRGGQAHKSAGAQNRGIVGRTRQAEAARAKPLPSASQRESLKTRLDNDLAKLTSLRPKVGEHGYAAGKISNLNDRVMAGLVDTKQAMAELREIRNDLPVDAKTEALKPLFNSVESNILANPLRTLSALADQSGKEEAATAFRDFFIDLNKAMDLLKCGSDTNSINQAHAILMHVQIEGLLNNELVEGMPTGETRKALISLSDSLQKLLNSAELKLDLTDRAGHSAKMVGLSNALAQAIENASSLDSYNPPVFKETVTGLLDECQAQGLDLEKTRAALQANPLAQREALNILHDLKVAIFDNGLVDKDLGPRAEILYKKALIGMGSQFTENVSNPSDFRLIPPQVEQAPLVDRQADIEIRLAMNSGDPKVNEDLKILNNDLDLFNLSTVELDQGAIAQGAKMRQLQADWGLININTDLLSEAQNEASAYLSGLSDEGHDNRFLSKEIASFDQFRLGREESFRAEIKEGLDQTADLLEGSSTVQQLEDLAKSLEAALNRLNKDPKAGEQLKAEMGAKVETAKNLIALKILDRQLEELQTAKATPLNLDAVMARHGANPDTQAKISQFSQERLQEITTDIDKVALPENPDPYAGITVMAQLDNLESRSERLLLSNDAQTAKAAMAERKDVLRKNLGELAFQRIDPKITLALSDSQKANLLTALSGSFANEALVQLINSEVPSGGGDLPDTFLAKTLADSVGGSTEAISKAVDSALLSRPDMDRTALDIKLSLTPASAHDQVISDHTDSRLKRQTFAQLKQGGAQDLLDTFNLKSGSDLTSELMINLLSATTTSDKTQPPSFVANSFNTLLVQTAWSSYVRENNLAGNDQDLEAFKALLPEAFKNSSIDVLRGMFQLGPLSGSDMRRASEMAKKGGNILARFEIGLLMDNMADHSPRLMAQRASTTMLRNMLTSSSIEFNIEDDNSRAYFRALTKGLAKRAEDLSRPDKVIDALLQKLDFETKGADTKTFAEQMDISTAKIQELSGVMDKVRKREAEAEAARKVLDEVMKTSFNPDWEKLNFKSGEPGDKNPEIRKSQLADNYRFLVHQEALNASTKTIDTGKVEGEQIAYCVLGFKDTLSGNIQGLDTREAQLNALKDLKLPKRIDIKHMRDSKFHKKNPEGTRLLNNFKALQALKSDDSKFSETFDSLKQAIMDDISEYHLDDKSEIILSLKDSSEKVRLRSDGGVDYKTVAKGLLFFGDSVWSATREMVVAGAVGSNSAVVPTKAVERAMDKVDLLKAKTPEGQLLKRHFFTGKTLTLRGSAANLFEVQRQTLADARVAYLDKKDVLSEAMKDLTFKTQRLLTEATRLSTLAAFASLDYQTFEEAESSLRDRQGDDRLRTRIEKNLMENFGLSKAMAGALIEANIDQPLSRETMVTNTDERPGVLESFCQDAHKSLDVIIQDIDIYVDTPEAMRDMVLSETNRLRFAALLDQLDPNSAMDFSTQRGGALSVGVIKGPVKVGGAIDLAMKDGFSLGRDENGVYQMAIRGGYQGALGGGTNVLDGVLEAGLGLAASTEQCLSVDFKSRDDAAAFLQKISDKSFSPEDIYLHCQNVRISDTNGATVALKGQVELGKIKIMDNTTLAIGAVFTAGFEASGALQRITETDANAQTISTTTTLNGQVGVDLSVGRTHTQEQDEDEERYSTFAARDALENAMDNETEVNQRTRKIFGQTGNLDAGYGYEDGALNVRLGISASTSSTVTRSTKSDANNILEGSTKTTTLKFTGPYAESQFRQYSIKNLGLDSNLIKAMVVEFQARGSDFTLETTNELKPEVLAHCQDLEATDSNKKEVKALLKNESNYQLTSVKMTFEGRSASAMNINLGVSFPFVGFEVTWGSTAQESLTVQYKAQNGPIKSYS
ncbi:MAG: hypothetical protein LBE80_10160 [Deltaproteobacteria bacterium]|jgi:hypothetical protein|nr:hypothetical protein [Deltaproteobacteria bacterium]